MPTITINITGLFLWVEDAGQLHLLAPSTLRNAYGDVPRHETILAYKAADKTLVYEAIDYGVLDIAFQDGSPKAPDGLAPMASVGGDASRDFLACADPYCLDSRITLNGGRGSPAEKVAFRFGGKQIKLGSMITWQIQTNGVPPYSLDFTPFGGTRRTVNVPTDTFWLAHHPLYEGDFNPDAKKHAHKGQPADHFIALFQFIKNPTQVDIPILDQDYRGSSPVTCVGATASLALPRTGDATRTRDWPA